MTIAGHFFKPLIGAGLAVALGGVISGEHGIGITKYHYLESDKAEAFARYKAEVDPQGFFNRGKLLPGELPARGRPHAGNPITAADATHLEAFVRSGGILILVHNSVSDLLLRAKSVAAPVWQALHDSSSAETPMGQQSSRKIP